MKKFVTIILCAVMLLAGGNINTFAANEKPYTAEYLFCPGSIGMYVFWATDGENFYCSDASGSTVYTIDIATGKWVAETDLEVSYNGKLWTGKILGGLHYNYRNGKLIAADCSLKRTNPLSGTSESLDGVYAIDVFRQEVIYKQNKAVLGVFSNGDILEMGSYSNGIQTTKRLTYPNYSSSSATYTFYNVGDTSRDYGIFNVNGTDYLLNSESIYYATGGYPAGSTYGNIIGAGKNSFVMIKNADIFYTTASGTILEQFSLDDVEDTDDGNIYHSKGNPLLVSNDGDIIYLDKDWGEFRKISKRAVAVGGVSLNKSSISLYVGESFTLTETVTPADAKNKKVSWSSSNEGVATVNNGTVTAVAPGSATIKVTTVDGGYTASCSVTVSKFVPEGYTNIDDKLTYNIESGKAAITGYTGTISGKVTFSSVIDGYEVAKINAYAFKDCTMTDIILPESLADIGNNAFSGCEDLVSVHLPANLENISYKMLADCPKLSSVTITENSWLSVKDNVLYANDETALVVYPAAKSGSAFAVPSTVKTICSHAFDSNKNLRTISIPASVEVIDEKFNTCKKIVAFEVDGSNKNFEACGDVLFTKGKTTLLVYPVAKRDASYEVPEGVKTIGSSAFSSNEFIESVVLADGVETICELAFELVSLKSIVIPKSLKTVEDKAFMLLDSLEVFYKGTESQWKNISVGNYNGDLTEAVIHYALPEMRVENISTNTYYYIDVYSEAYEEGAKVYAVMYDSGGKFLQLALEDAAENDVTAVVLRKNSKAAAIKVFMVGKQLNPITSSKTLEVD